MRKHNYHVFTMLIKRGFQTFLITRKCFPVIKLIQPFFLKDSGEQTVLTERMLFLLLSPFSLCLYHFWGAGLPLPFLIPSASNSLSCASPILAFTLNVYSRWVQFFLFSFSSWLLFLVVAGCLLSNPIIWISFHPQMATSSLSVSLWIFLSGV